MRPRKPLGSPRLATAAATAACGLALVLGATSPAAARCPTPAGQFTPDPAFTSTFLAERCSFATRGVNPFFVLLPGYRIELESEEEAATITVLGETRVVDGVPTRVVEELSWELDGDERTLVERSLNYFAICRQTGSVFYFGEDVEFFDEEGNVIGREGAWLAGRNGARPGIVMPGTVLLGARYYEEIAPEDSALDKGEVLAIEEDCGDGRACVTIRGSNDCDDDEDEKTYAEGIGVIADDDLELVRAGFEGRRPDRVKPPKRRLPRLPR
ncbi:MAG: hypothetical protein AB1689_06080 [Thermodesulfobacteriota bacterium]